MQNNNINPYLVQPCLPANPNAVNINIIKPEAYATNPNCAPVQPYYSLYGANVPNMPLYPQNYNNLMVNQGYGYPSNGQPNNGIDTNKSNMSSSVNLINKTDNASDNKTSKTENKKTKKIVPLTDEYVKSIENYMNNDNPKLRLIGTKELMERFKEDENRKDNPSLMPLLNKALKDPSPSVRFLALTTLQLGYAVGNDETVQLLKQIQSQNKDKIGEDSILASEILLNMAAPEKVDVPMTEAEIEKANKANNSQKQQGEK